MPLAVKFRGKEFALESYSDEEFMFDIEEDMADVEELPGSFILETHEQDGVERARLAESDDPDELPFEGIRANHPELGEMYIFAAVSDDRAGEHHLIYSNVTARA